MTDQPGPAPRSGEEKDQPPGTVTDTSPATSTVPATDSAAAPETGSRDDSSPEGTAPAGMPPEQRQPDPADGPEPASDPHGPGPVGPQPGPPNQPGPVGPAAGTADPAGRNALWLAISGLALTLLASVWGALAGLVLCSAGFVIGIRARRRARRSRTVAPGAEVGIAVGAAGLVFSLAIAGMSAVLYQEMTTYGRCMNIANTHSDREQCQQQFLRSVERKFGQPVGQLEGSPLFG